MKAFTHCDIKIMEYLNIFIKSAFIDNMVFTFFFGMCSYLAVSKTVKTAVGLGSAVIFVLVVTTPINYLLETLVLQEGALAWLGDEYATMDLSFLSFIMFIAVIASIVQLVEMLVEKFSPALYGALGIFLPLIAVNCAILGAALFMQQKQFANIGQATVYGLGSGFGWFIAIVLIAAIREKIKYSHIPGPLRGVGMSFLLTGLMGLAFLGFLGFEL
jgi:Na+-transporting NADH:ubiquinone oxidoreductase subunit E